MIFRRIYEGLISLPVSRYLAKTDKSSAWARHLKIIPDFGYISDPIHVGLFLKFCASLSNYFF